MIQASPPIFSNDLSGYVKLAIAVFGSGSIMGGLVGYWIKNKNDTAMATITGALNGLGGRVTAVETSTTMDSAWRSEQHAQKARDDAKFTNLGERLSKQEAAMERLEKDLNEHHKEQRDLIQTSAEKQVEAVHRLELQIVSLKEQSNLGDCMVEMGKSMERAIRLAMGTKEPQR